MQSLCYQSREAVQPGGGKIPPGLLGVHQQSSHSHELFSDCCRKLHIHVDITRTCSSCFIFTMAVRYLNLSEKWWDTENVAGGDVRLIKWQPVQRELEAITIINTHTKEHK